MDNKRVRQASASSPVPATTPSSAWMASIAAATSSGSRAGRAGASTRPSLPRSRFHVKHMGYIPAI